VKHPAQVHERDRIQRAAAQRMTSPGYTYRARQHSAQMLQSVACLVGAGKTVSVRTVLAGLDASPGGFDAAVALAERQSLPVWLAPNASRVGFPTDHPLFRGSLPSAIAWLSSALAGHDLVLVAGAPVFQYYPYAPGPYVPDGATLMMITDDPDAAARAPIGGALLGDPGLALGLLGELVPLTRRPVPGPRAPVEVPTAPDMMTAGQVHEALGQLQKAQALGLKARTPILQRSGVRAVAVSPSREALLAQLDNLSPGELQSLLKRVLEGKQSA